MPAEPTAATDPDSTAEHIKTAIDEDKLCFLLFAISVVLPELTSRRVLLGSDLWFRSVQCHAGPVCL